MDFNGSHYPSQYHVSTFTHNETCPPWHPPQIAAPTQQEFNRNWGPEQIKMMVSLAQDSGYPGMNHVDGTTLTYGHPPPAQPPAAATGYQCAWLEKQSRCGEWFPTLAELVVHLGEIHEACGTANKPLVCQWDIGGSPCNAKFRRDNFKCHIQTHFGIADVCEDCGKSYSRLDTLKKHVKKYHPRQ